jgi:hypothetical protein
MDISIFSEKEKIPTNADLKLALNSNYDLWIEIRDFVFEKYPKATEEWNYPGKNFGWSFRIKDKKRAIIYLLPRENYFKAAFNFGQKAYELILQSDISSEIKTELENARVYAEGRGIRIEVKDESILNDIKKLIEIKIFLV